MVKKLMVFLFGESKQGEPAYTNTQHFDVRDSDGFYEWCVEYNVGCRTENNGVYFDCV
jgi:hypothetical protein